MLEIKILELYGKYIYYNVNDKKICVDSDGPYPFLMAIYKYYLYYERKNLPKN